MDRRTFRSQRLASDPSASREALTAIARGSAKANGADLRSLRLIEVGGLPSGVEVTVEVDGAGGHAVHATAAVPEIIQDQETGLLFDPESLEDLTRSILQLLQNPALAVRMGCAGRKRAEANFTWQRVTSKMAKRIQAEVDLRT